MRGFCYALCSMDILQQNQINSRKVIAISAIVKLLVLVIALIASAACGVSTFL